MPQPPDPSPRAQAILRAIENEAQARRQSTERQQVPGAYTPPTAPIPPMPPPLPPVYAAAPPQPAPLEFVPQQHPEPQPLGEAADRLMRLVDHVVAQTEGVRARVKEVEQSLDVLSGKLAQPATIKPAFEDPATAVAPPPAVVQAQAPVAAPQQPVAPQPAAPESDGARLMAIEMAVSGSSRGEVADRLTHDFGVGDPAPILDDVFGAGSPNDSRMPWTS